MTKKNIFNLFTVFIFFHLIIWTLIPSLSNKNLPLDTIEALAWSSNLDWGFNKHPPMSAFLVGFVNGIFGNQDWSYYFLSQVFVVISFIYVWKFSKIFFESDIYSLLSVLLLEGIIFYNFTTPEFNVYVSQLPFRILTVYYCWRCLNKNNTIDFFLLGIFSAFGFLSHYLFIYLLISIFFYLVYLLYQKKNISSKIYISAITFVIIIMPHFIWLFNNDFITLTYASQRSTILENDIFDHIINPILFMVKQIGILTPFFLMVFLLLKKVKFNFNLKDNKMLFLLVINILPLALLFVTSILLGSKIRTMWVSPFYLSIGILFLYSLKKHIDLKKIKKFLIVFIFILILSPSTYLIISLSQDNKRTDYPGKEISDLVQRKWTKNFSNEIMVVIGDEWSAGNLSYHLNSRPKWFNEMNNEDLKKIDPDYGFIYVGNPKILKNICPGIFGSITRVGYCMIGIK
tara:strand:+ start:795 stop:2168 length:1374 start_codon:yes stop_codon:yes gene_type:complete